MGLKLEDHQAVVALTYVPDRPGVAALLFEALSKRRLKRRF